MTNNGNSNASGRLPDRVVAFIREHIDSVELLEVLLLLHHDPSRAWTVADVAAELRLQPRSVQGRCNTLMNLNLLVKGQTPYRFDASSPTASVVEELAATYRTHRVSVIELIFSKPRPPTGATAFADAFVFRKGDKGDNDGGHNG